jgi:uncharacterized membrane protein
MTLGLILACLYVIFHRSGSRWRTAGRMLMSFIAVIVLFIAVMSFFPRFEGTINLIAAISALTAAMIAGFRHAKAFPRSRPESPRHSP